MRKIGVLLLSVFALAAVAAACSSDNTEKPTLFIAGIPDQNADRLARRYEVLTEYLESELEIKVEYVPTVDYAATVTGFRQNDIQMAWFGGLTGVQARLAVPDSKAIAQRPIDEEFHSKFIVQADLDVDNLEDLKGLRFTFGSESSTSGHLMPRHFLLEAGVDPDKDFNGPPNFSGSHDTTWKLVEAGSFQAGALNEAVWDNAVDSGEVDLTKVREFWVTPPYYDYNWTIRGDVDIVYGAGFVDKVKATLLKIGEEQPELLEELFDSREFIETQNENYNAILEVAESIGIIR